LEVDQPDCAPFFCTFSLIWVTSNAPYFGISPPAATLLRLHLVWKTPAAVHSECGQIFDLLRPNLTERLLSTTFFSGQMCSMKKIRSVAFAVCLAGLLLTAVPTAQAIECNVARPSDTSGHWWSWRLIDGRKCWYEGKSMISKSLLQWPAEASAQPTLEGTSNGVPEEKPHDPLNSQARVVDDEVSFEARWRARALGN
jgi:hypothetical protein